MLERRIFLSALTATIATTVLPVGVLAAALKPKVSMREQFARIIDQEVQLTDAAGVKLRARLVRLDDGPSCAGLEQYSMVFEGAEISEGIYELRHPDIGHTHVTLFAVGRPRNGVSRQRSYVSRFV